MAKRRVPPAVFDYTDGAAGTEASLRRAREVFASVEFTPRVLQGVANIDPSVDLLGQRSSLPFALAPTGFTRMMNHVGEPAVAKAAGERGIPYTLSTLGTTSPEDLAAAAPNTRKWFQLYVWRDRSAAEALVRRAQVAGFDTLVLTVDTAVGGIRQRDVRNGLTIPPQLSARTLAQMALYPRWWMNVLTTDPLEFASLSTSEGHVGDMFAKLFDPSLTADDVSWLRSVWEGPLVIKGVQSVEDAVVSANMGADAVVLSNHGGRQIDMGNVPLELLPEVVRAVGDRVEVYLDGGVMTGADIVAALALGARGTLIGRAYLYGLMAGGYDGVVRVLDILEKEIRTTMQLLGVGTVADLAGSGIRLRPQPQR
jgi:L-lactate dehydrogenase (cytochrome)